MNVLQWNPQHETTAEISCDLTQPLYLTVTCPVLAQSVINIRTETGKESKKKITNLIMPNDTNDSSSNHS